MHYEIGGILTNDEFVLNQNLLLRIHCAVSLDSSMYSTTIHDVIYQNVTNLVCNMNPLANVWFFWSHKYKISKNYFSGCQHQQFFCFVCFEGLRYFIFVHENSAVEAIDHSYKLELNFSPRAISCTQATQTDSINSIASAG